MPNLRFDCEQNLGIGYLGYFSCLDFILGHTLLDRRQTSASKSQHSETQVSRRDLLIVKWRMLFPEANSPCDMRQLPKIWIKAMIIRSAVSWGDQVLLSG